MKIKSRIEKIVTGFVKSMTDDPGTEDISAVDYRQFSDNGQIKVLITAIHVDSFYGDGHAIAVLNPGIEVLGKIYPAIYEGNMLNRIVKRKCDAMYEFTLEDGLNSISCYNKYEAKNTAVPRIGLQDLRTYNTFAYSNSNKVA